MSLNPSHELPKFLVENISRELVLAIEEGLLASSERAFLASQQANPGHQTNVLGQLRHFHNNEAFHLVLENHGLSPSPIRGNKIITSRSGIGVIGRFNSSEPTFSSGRRSKTRKDMASVNEVIQTLIQPTLFETNATRQFVLFFVAEFNERMQEKPAAIWLAVPNSMMTNWLFCERVEDFLSRYELSTPQLDLATPTLKKRIPKDGTDFGSEQ